MRLFRSAASLAALSLACLAYAAPAAVIRFDNLGVGNDADIPQRHQDITGQIDVQYRGVDVNGYPLKDEFFPNTSPLNFWGSGYGFANCAYAGFVGQDKYGEVALIPWVGYKVTLSSFRVSSWGSVNNVRIRVWQDRVGFVYNQLHNLNGSPITISPNVTSSYGLRVQFEAEDGYVAVDDITYTVATGGAPVTGYPMPPDSGALNVTHPPFNAWPGDGVDDTQAIRNAIAWALANGGGVYRESTILYFPDGQYDVSDEIRWANLNKTLGSSQYFRAGARFHGQSRDGTIIRLKDSSPGYGSSVSWDNRKAIFRTGSENGGNEAFGHFFRHMTLHAGNNNPHAIGLDYHVSNWGSVENVKIAAGTNSGWVGLSLDRGQPGPGLIKNVTIDGFDYGISMDNYDFGMTFEHLYLNAQKVCAVYLLGNLAHMRGVQVTNGPAVGIEIGAAKFNVAKLTLIDSSFSSASPGGTAIRLGQGKTFLRNLTKSGYSTFVDNNSGGGSPDVTGSTIAEWKSHPVKKLFSNSPDNSMNLPIQETPEYNNVNFTTDWVNVMHFGAFPNDSEDDTAEIQAAINAAGARVVYFPSGTYNLSSQLIVSDSSTARMLEGNYSHFVTSRADGHVFRFTKSGGDPVILARITVSPMLSSTNYVTHEGNGTLVVEHGGLNVRTTANTGKTFIEDLTGGQHIFGTGHTVFARQVNPEDLGYTYRRLITVDGATAWFLGSKFEGRANTAVEVKNGGRAELLGHYFYAGSPNENVNHAAYTVVNGELSIGAGRVGGHSYITYQLKESRGTTTQTDTSADAALISLRPN